jgi:uncharacterized membrane protein
MKPSSRKTRAAHLLLLGTAFVVSTYAVSNLMPLLLQTLSTGFSLTNTVSIAGYFVATIVSVVFLARAIYRLDQRAGRIRNRVKWFEQ